MTKKDYLTLNEVCQELRKSKRTISRYIKKGILNPERVKSENGIMEYRFKISEIEKIKNPDNMTRQKTRQNTIFNQKDDDILSLVMLLEKQLKAKDRQIKQLLDRQRETNILMGQLQNRVLLLEDKSKGKKDRTEDTTSDRIKSFFGRFFGVKK